MIHSDIYNHFVSLFNKILRQKQKETSFTYVFIQDPLTNVNRQHLQGGLGEKAPVGQNGAVFIVCSTVGGAAYTKPLFLLFHSIFNTSVTVQSYKLHKIALTIKHHLSFTLLDRISTLNLH